MSAGIGHQVRLCACVRDGLPPRQHVTRPTGVAETVFDEDPEAEEAAVALEDDPFLQLDTPTRSAPDPKTTSLQESVEGERLTHCLSITASYVQLCCHSIGCFLLYTELKSQA